LVIGVAMVVGVEACDASGAASGTAPTSATVVAPPAVFTGDSARFARPVVTHAREAGIDAQLLMAIVYNESYKPHDPAFERAWLRAKPDAALGVVNMHQATFDDTKRGRDFAGRDWHELPDDPDLAIKAAAWFLHDLAARLPANPSPGYTRDELLAIGYNAGASTMRAVARGAQPGATLQSYVDTLRHNWSRAGDAVAHA
jgi:soluble lytic murein transglycosylase-like protein